MFHEDVAFPPYGREVRCPVCGQTGQIEVQVDGGNFYVNESPCEHVRLLAEEAAGKDSRLLVLWGGVPGYTVLPRGFLARFGGAPYRYAAPLEVGLVEVVGERDGVVIAITPVVGVEVLALAGKREGEGEGTVVLEPLGGCHD